MLFPPVIYDESTATFRPIIDRGLRAGLVLAVEWTSLSLIEEAPRYWRIATLVIAALVLAVLESRTWLHSRRRGLFPGLLAGLLSAWAAICTYAYMTLPDGSHKSRGDTGQLCWDGKAPPCNDQPATSNLKPAAPQFLKNISIGSSPKQPLVLTAKANVTTDRLRIFVDYAQAAFGRWIDSNPPVRVSVGQIREPVKDQGVEIQLAYRELRQGNDIWWGDPSLHYPISVQNPMGLEEIGLYRVRVSIVGPGGNEQHYYFILLRAASNLPLTIIPETTSWWVGDWEKQ
jgi:hypothetical protein